MKWLIASAAVFILGFFNVFAPVRGGVQYVFNPIQYGVQQMSSGFRDWLDFYTNLQQVRKENLVLLEESEKLNSQVVQLEELKEENELLRNQLDIGLENNEETLLLVKVLGNPEDKTGTSVLINKGGFHGISENDILIRGRYLIGIVKEVSKFRSKVELITSPSISVSVRDLQTGTEGTASGQFGTSLFVNRVLPEDEVSVGDTFVSSGRDGVVPPGYIVGEVSSVSEDSAKVLKNVSLDVLINLNSISKAFVLSRIK